MNHAMFSEHFEIFDASLEIQCFAKKQLQVVAEKQFLLHQVESLEGACN